MNCLKVLSIIPGLILKFLAFFINISTSFKGSDGEDSRKDSSRARRRNEEEEDLDKYSDEEEEDEEDIGDFIVDAEGQPIHGKKKKRKAIYTDA